MNIFNRKINFKIGFQYIDGLVSDFDLLVIGGYYNPSNKFIYKYLVGVQKKTSLSTVVRAYMETEKCSVFYLQKVNFLLWRT